MAVTSLPASTLTLPLTLLIAAKFTLGQLFGAVPGDEQGLTQSLHPPPDTAMSCNLVCSSLTEWTGRGWRRVLAAMAEANLPV